VEHAQHLRDGGERLVGGPVRGQRVLAALAGDERQDLAALLVDAQRARRAGEADVLQVAQQGVHGGVQGPALRRTVSPTR
jgi:hypothetical protein